MPVSLIIGSAALLISIIACISRYSLLEPDWLRLFAYFLSFEFVVQLSGWLYSHFTHRSNHFIFNGLIITEFIFYLFIIYKGLSRPELKMAVKIITWIFIILALSNLLFFESVHKFNEHTYTLGTLLVILACLLYFAEIFMSETIVNFFRLPMFWISTGLFFFYAGNGIYLSILNYIERNNLDPDGKVYIQVMVILNLLLNILCTIGFLCNGSWKKAKP